MHPPSLGCAARHHGVRSAHTGAEAAADVSESVGGIVNRGIRYRKPYGMISQGSTGHEDKEEEEQTMIYQARRGPWGVGVEAGVWVRERAFWSRMGRAEGEGQAAAVRTQDARHKSQVALGGRLLGVECAVVGVLCVNQTAREWSRQSILVRWRAHPRPKSSKRGTSRAAVPLEPRRRPSTDRGSSEPCIRYCGTSSYYCHAVMYIHTASDAQYCRRTQQQPAASPPPSSLPPPTSELRQVEHYTTAAQSSKRFEPCRSLSEVV
jgi:hypothetical protein